MHPRKNESKRLYVCGARDLLPILFKSFISSFSSILFFIFGSGYSCLFFSYHFCLCVCLCVCAAVCVAGLFAMVLCSVARQRLTLRGNRVKRRHTLFSRNRFRRSGWTHRNILVHPDSHIMNIVYLTSALKYVSIMT
jgi:hypothetical protein